MATLEKVKVRRGRKKMSTIVFLRMLILCSCVVIIGVLLSKIWMKWFENLESIILKGRTTPVWQIPFPAITICSESKIRQTVYNFTEKFHNRTFMNDDELSRFEAYSLVCENHILKNGTKFTDESVIDLIKSVAPDLKSLLYICLWKTTVKKCEALFSPIITEEGLCYTFNMIEPHELFTNEMNFKPYSKQRSGTEGWSWNEGYLEISPFESYPIRGSGSGALSGMAVVLRSQNFDLDHLCRGTAQGFKISLHSPAEYPSVSQNYFRVPFEQEIMVKIKPKLLKTSKNLRGYNPRERRCYFSNERKLQYFKLYSKRNCEIECLSNYTSLLCDCVTFSMPRDVSIPICSAGSMKCANFARSDLALRQTKVNFVRYNPLENDIEGDLNEIVKECDCLPSCTTIDYDYEVLQSTYDRKKLYEAYGEELVRDESLARVVLYFENSQFIAYEQTIVTDQSHLYACTVAVLGILLVLSVLGVIDSLYKFSRLIVRKNRSHSMKDLQQHTVKTEMKI